MAKSSAIFGLLFFAWVSSQVTRGEETLPPLQLSVKLDADLVPHLSLKNISKQDVRVIVANGQSLNQDWKERVRNVYRVSVLPEPSPFSLESWIDRKEEHELRTRMLGPGEMHELMYTQLCGFLRVRKGEFKITVKYEVEENHAKHLPLTEREMLWLGKIESEPACLKIDGPPFGVGTIENAELWAEKHRYPAPLINMIAKDDHSSHTLRLWLPNYAAGDNSIFGAWESIDGIPKTWTMISADIVTPVLFRKTGIGMLYPMTKEAAKALQDEKVEALPSLPWLHDFGFTEQGASKIVDRHDFDWIRDLDDARIHYRYVWNEYFGGLFEVWEEEYKDSKPEMDQFIKAMIKYYERRESKNK